MKFNQEYFDAGLNRVGTRSEKWDLIRDRTGREDLLPLWVADMDFPSPPAVEQAVLARAAHPTFGYTEPLDDDYEAFINFWQRRHHVTIQREEVLMQPCVLTAARVALRTMTNPGDGVIICTPVYGSFFSTIESCGRVVVDCPMIRREDAGYDLDFAAIEQALKNGARALLFCNPHNPCGRIWTEEELRRIVSLCEAYDALFVSDEIHADFILDGADFISSLHIGGKKAVTLCAASKTFNLAGLQQAMLVCRDPEMVKKLAAETLACGIRSGNIFALEATRAAYNEGDAWLDGLLTYIAGNRDELAACLKELLPDAVMTPLQATYLCWIDLRSWGFNSEELDRRCTEADVYFTSGTFFGTCGDGFIRFNIACPRRYIREGVLRLKKALG